MDRTNEIIWWNRQLSKLDDPNFTNYVNFIKEKLVEVKGPYIEYVRPPEICKEPIGKFLRSLNYSEVAIRAFTQVLFNGDETFHLYWHQSQAMQILNKSNNPLVVSVPTATGKTEIFIFPLLNYCVQCNQKGLKGLIIYPTKTLEVDQVNRFVRYLDKINEKPEVDPKITIGIWDGDTPSKIGYDVQSNEIPVGSYLRGLECPKCRQKLRIGELRQLECEEHGTFAWLRATKQEIRKGVDILISNPEALDFQYVSPDKSTQGILGEVAGESPLKYLIFDEAHVWTGVTGAGIQLLVKRLMNFFRASNPNLILLSATISDPTYLGMRLSGNPDVNVVVFKPAKTQNPSNFDFTNIRPCNFEELLQTLAYVKYRTSKKEEILDEVSNSENALHMLKVCDLITENDSLRVTDLGTQLLDCVPILSGQDMLNAEKLAEVFLDSDKFSEIWRNIVLDSLPEVNKIASYFPDTGSKPSFIHQEKLVSHISNESGLPKDESEFILDALMNFGRPAYILTNKYHYFIKPPSQIFFCEKCQRLSTTDICGKCEEICLELMFCRNCHLPYYADGGPFDDKLKVENGKCPNCSTRLRLVKPNVPYSSLVTFLASSLIRILPSRKVLLFSDSRNTAERIGSDMLRNDYSLVAQQILIKIILDNDNKINSKQLFSILYEELKERYYNYLHQQVDYNDVVSQKIINEILDQKIRPLTYLNYNRRIIDESIITPQVILELEEPIDSIIAHEIYKIMLTRRSFQMKKIKVDGLTPEKITKSLERRLTNLTLPKISDKVKFILRKMVDGGVLQQIRLDDVYTKMGDKGIKEENIEYVREYLESQLVDLNNKLKNDEDKFSSPLFIHMQFDSMYILSLIENISYCHNCYSSWPTSRKGALICPKCGDKLSYVSRWEDNNNGRLPYFSSVEYCLDHWGNDISYQAAIHDIDKIPYGSVGVNRAGIPASLRGIIEEGFRKSDPKINIISTTPVMELGIDIGTLDVVCQIGIPPTVSNYVQRSGRAGRSKGRSSLIISVIRGDHPIDSYYFDRLDQFLISDDEVYIPDPFKFQTILDSHVATESLSYLARNPDPQNIYKLAFTNPQRSGNANQLSSAILRRIKALTELVSKRKRKELEKHVRTLFGSDGVLSLNRIFLSSTEKSLLFKAQNVYGRLSGVGNAQVNPYEGQRQLSNWMSRLGYLANYRGTLDQLPLSLERKGGASTLEFKSLDYALRENFPGECHSDGAIFSIETTKYVVTNVTGLNNLLTSGNMCVNFEAHAREACPFPFKVYSEDQEDCPFCTHELEAVKIYEIGSIHTRSVRRLGDNFETYAHMSTRIDCDLPETLEGIDFFGFPSELSYNPLEVTSFTAAFDKRYRGFGKAKTYRSLGQISETIDDISELDAISELLEEEKSNCHPVGYSIKTYGLKIDLNKNDLEKRVGKDNWLNKIMLTSLMQVMKRAVCIVIKCELQDFDVDFTVSEDVLSLFLYDRREGGNNISERIYLDLVGKKELLKQIGYLANCKYCSKFCNRCLLIQRTPSYMVEKGLLDRQELKRLLNV